MRMDVTEKLTKITYKQAAEQVIQYMHFYNTVYGLGFSFDTIKYEEFLRKNFKYRVKP